MAKIIKVGSQNPTFTSLTNRSGSIQTHRNSNDVTNPFKFTNFEGNTLQFADVFEGFKPSFKANPVNKMRIVASSVTGSMNKIRTNFTESVVNFANRVCSGISSAWDYAKNTNISDVPGFKQMNKIFNTQINIPVIDGLASNMGSLKEKMGAGITSINDKTTEWKTNVATHINDMVSNISFKGKQKYSNMTVVELETAFRAALAEGGINE